MTPEVESDTERWIEEILAEGVPELSVTNETLVDVYLSADQSISAGSLPILALDTKDKDELGEFDTGTHQFTPGETGWYLITLNVLFVVSADQDTLTVELYNSTTGSALHRDYKNASGSTVQTAKFSIIHELTAGDSYVIRVQNSDSNDTIMSDKSRTSLQIRRVFR